MEKKKMSLRRLAGTGGVLALVVAGTLGGAGMASAAVGPDQPGHPATGTIVVHKYAGSTTQQPDNGTEQTVNRPTLNGVTFTATQVGVKDGANCVAIDLTTSAGWTAAQAIPQNAAPADPYCLTSNVVTKVTGAAGETAGTATFANLPLGMYYVNETAAPAGVTPSVSFYASVPYPNASGATVDWLYTVHTYPKNDLTGDGGKTVADPASHGLGSTIPWTIKSKPLGSFNGGVQLQTFKLIDHLDPKLTYSATPATTFTYTTPGGTAQAVDSSDYSLTTTSPNVVAEVTDLAWLNSLPAGTYFELTFSTTVNGVGSISNTGYQNSGGDDVTLGTASTQWGPAEILKHQKGDLSKTLKGAKFSVYDSGNGTDCTTLGAAALTVNGATEFESNASGIVAIAGLFVGNNNATPSRVYCAVETAAPAGFVLDATPHMITVKAETTATTTAHIDVENAPVPGPMLPLTGSNGTLWFTVGGVALIVIAAGALLMMRRARSHE